MRYDPKMLCVPPYTGKSVLYFHIVNNIEMGSGLLQYLWQDVQHCIHSSVKLCN